MQPSNSNNSSGLKNSAFAACAVFGIVLAFMFGITSSEETPDRARFLVNKKNRYVVPEPLPGRTIFYSLPSQDDEVFAQFDGTVTWAELRKKDHPYHDYGLPQTREWDAFVEYGESVSFFRSIFFPPPSRWDEDGRWRY